MDDELKPDFDIDEWMQELTTEAQKLAVTSLEAYGWQATHIWEKKPDVFMVWMISHTIGKMVKGTWNHCYITPSGDMVRYK